MITDTDVDFYHTLSDEALEKEITRTEHLDSKYRLEWSNDPSFTIYCDDEDDQKTYTRHLKPIIGILPLTHKKNKDRFISIGLDNSIQISKNKGTQLKTLTAHDERILGVVELYNGNLVSVSADGYIRFWNTKSGKLLSEIETSLVTLDQVKFFPFNDIIAIKEIDSVSIWQFTGECIVKLEGQVTQIQSANRLLSGNWLIWTMNSPPSLWTQDGNFIKTFPYSFSAFSDYCELDSQQLIIKVYRGIYLYDKDGLLQSYLPQDVEVSELFDHLIYGREEAKLFINKNNSVSHFQHVRNSLATKKSLFYPYKELEKQSLEFEEGSDEHKVWNFFSRPIFEKIKTALKSVIKVARTKEKILLTLIEESESRKKRFMSDSNSLKLRIRISLGLLIAAVSLGGLFAIQPSLLYSLISGNKGLLAFYNKSPYLLLTLPAVLISIYSIYFSFVSKNNLKNIKSENQHLEIINVILLGYHHLIDGIKQYRKDLTDQIPVLQKETRDLYQGKFIRSHIDEIITGKLQKIAMDECGLDKDDIIYTEQEPIILPTWSLIQAKEERAQIASKLVFENEYSFWPVKGGALVSAVQFIQYTFLTKDKIDVFTTYYDFITNKAVGKEANAFYYKDVTNIAKREVERDDILEGRNQDISATEIILSVASGEKIRLTILNEDSLSIIHQQTKDVETISPEMLLKKLEDEYEEIQKDDDLSDEDKEDELKVVTGRISEAKANLFELDSSQTSNKADDAIKNIRNQLQQHKKEM